VVDIMVMGVNRTGKVNRKWWLWTQTCSGKLDKEHDGCGAAPYGDKE
jgi:hypothetical protein